ncbi:MAG: Txe/YoeB family addiction module toxin [Oscillospiraceae bacterium]|nr:Txe/YoeB family addiction module toxin [Oscillospiraceae bacterium]
MGVEISFTERGFEEYLFWQGQDRKTLKRINILLQDIRRNPFDGIGKPEALRENLTGLWSRRIDGVNRLVYHVSDEKITIHQCRGHYEPFHT